MGRRAEVLRASGALVEKVNGYAKRIEAETGAKITRAQAAEALIKLGLRAVTRVVDPLAQLAAAERKR